MVVLDDWERWTAINTHYSTDFAAYEVLRTAYNSANALRVQLQSDPLSAAFINEPVVPSRPCSPNRPPDYVGSLIRGPNMEHTTKYP